MKSKDSNSKKSVSYQKKDGCGHVCPSFFRYDNDKDLKVCFLVTCVICQSCEMSVVLIPSQIALFSQSPASEQMRVPLVLLALYPTMHCRVKMAPVRVGTEMSRTSEKLTVRFLHRFAEIYYTTNPTNSFEIAWEVHGLEVLRDLI